MVASIIHIDFLGFFNGVPMIISSEHSKYSTKEILVVRDMRPRKYFYYIYISKNVNKCLWGSYKFMFSDINDWY